MSRQTYMTLTATIFVVVGVAHLLRIIFGWSAEIGGWSVPFWLSWVAVPVAGSLAYLGFTLRR